MKKTIRMLTLLLALTLALTLIPSPAQAAEIVESGTCGSDLTWTLDSEGTLTISGEGAMWDEDEEPWAEYESDILSVVIEDGVTSIGYGAFFGHSNLTQITISDTVTSIEEYAFASCSRLKSVKIPDSVTAIGDYVFWHCFALTDVVLPAGLKGIASYMFSFCTSLQTITIPDGVTWIGKFAFSNTGLTSVVIPDSVTGIDWWAFSDTMLTSVTLPAGLIDSESFNINAFSGCTQLAEIKVDPDNPWLYTDDQGVLYAGIQCMWAPKSLSGSYKIQEGTYSIGKNAFSGCSELTDISIPESVDYIGSGAFSGCSGLKEINVPASVEFLDDGLFGGCVTLERIVVAEENEHYSSDSLGVLYNKSKTDLIQVPGGISGEFTVPEGVERISCYAFSGCGKITDITIPDSLAYLDNQSFGGNKSLKAIWASENHPRYSSDDTGVLYNKDKTDIIKVPEGYSGDLHILDTVSDIAYDAFTDCASISNVYIPAGLDAEELRIRTKGLSGIWVDEDNTMYSSDSCGALLNKEKTVLYQVPSGLSGTYTIPETVQEVHENAFYECVNLTRIVVPYIESMYITVFADCEALESIQFTGDATEVYWYEAAQDFISHPITIYYPGGNETWTDNVKTEYGDNVIWIGTYEILKQEDISLDLAEGKSLEVHIDADMDEFQSVTVDGTALESEYYTLKEGSTIVSVCVEYLQTLEHGEHTLEVYFNDGLAETVFHVTCTHSAEAEVVEGKAPTCTEAGYTGDQVCAKCGETVAQGEVIPALGHNEIVDPAKDAACTEEGLTEGKHCDRCGEVLTAQQTVPALGHSWSEWVETRPATEEAEGEEQRACPNCGETQTQNIPALVPVNPFVDVPENKYFFKPVLWAVEQGITSGTGDGTTFSPNSECTRGQIVMFLWRTAGKPEPTATESPFPDVTPGNSYYKAIMWAVEKGITSGQRDGTFGIKVPCNRQQTVMFLWRAAGQPEPQATKSPFSDVSASSSFFKAIMWAVEQDITKGTGDGSKFSPKDPCTRGQIVTFLYRAMAEE